MVTVISSSSLWRPANVGGRIDVPFAALLKFLDGEMLYPSARGLFDALFTTQRRSQDVMRELLVCSTRADGVSLLKLRVNIGTLPPEQEKRCGEFFSELIRSAITEVDQEAERVRLRREELVALPSE